MMTATPKPEIVVLYCGRVRGDGAPLPEGLTDYGDYLARFIEIPCSSEVRTEFLVKLIESGADGMLLVACPEAECRFLLGSRRAGSRLNYARKLLAEAAMEAARLSLVYRRDIASGDIIKLAAETAAAVRPLGDNVMRAARGNG